jgi:iron complex outermembrane receptor protein
MLASTSAVAFLAGGASGALAQAQAPDATASASADAAKPALEEIVVTGERNNKYGTDVVQAGSFRGAKTLDTPLTVSVITSAVLKSQQAIDLIDALRNTAGVTSSSGSPAVYNNLNIRGITVDTRSNFKLDGSLNALSSVAFPLEDKDRVEVLKGASALYYGFSNPSGIVNMTMKRPTENMLLNVTEFGDSHGGAGGAVDFGDTWQTGIGRFGARINGVYADQDLGIKYVKGHRYLIAGAFDYKPTSKLTLTMDVERFEKDIVEPASFRYTTLPTSTPANPYPKIVIPPLRNPKDNFGPNWATNDASETNLLGKANYKISSAWNLSAFVGQSRLHRIRFLPQFAPNASNPTATGLGTLTVSPQNSVFKNVNYAAELAGVVDLGPFKNELLVGASRGIKDSHTPIAVKKNFTNYNYLNPVFLPNPHLVPGTTADTTRIDDIGYYFFDRINFHDWFQVLGGVRKSDYTESNLTQNKQTFHANPLSYSYGAVLKPTKWASVYGTYIQGLETTPPAPTNATNQNQQLPPTKSSQREAGVKLEPWTGLLFQAAYFDIRRGSAYLRGDNVYVIDGRARYRGEEVSLTGNVTKDLSVILSATKLSAKQISGAPTSIIGGVFSPTAVGKRIEGTPKVTASLAAEYSLGKLIEGLSISGGVYYVGNQAINALNEAFVPAYTTYDLGASYTRAVANHPVTFRVNGQNITNKRYYVSTTGSTLAENLPSTIKFSVSTSF